jgi:DNA-directed RNA polymerase specialized sigma24 family protein
VSDDELHGLFVQDVDRGWRAFVDAYTPMLVGLLERAGLSDHDEAMEVYTLVCERLRADGCARLRHWSPAKGALGAWLAVVVRHTIVDWVRHRAGRRRLFGSIQALDAFHQEVFQMYFWDARSPSEIAEELSVRQRSRVSLSAVLDAVGRIHDTLTARQMSELCSAAVRARAPLSLDAAVDDGALDVADGRAGPEDRIVERQTAKAFDEALASLAEEDAAIVRLRYVEALSLAEIRRALHLPRLTNERVRGILDALRQRLAATTSALRPLDRLES